MDISPLLFQLNQHRILIPESVLELDSNTHFKSFLVSLSTGLHSIPPHAFIPLLEQTFPLLTHHAREHFAMQVLSSFVYFEHETQVLSKTIEILMKNGADRNAVEDFLRELVRREKIQFQDSEAVVTFGKILTDMLADDSETLEVFYRNNEGTLNKIIGGKLTKAEENNGETVLFADEVYDAFWVSLVSRKKKEVSLEEAEAIVRNIRGVFDQTGKNGVFITGLRIFQTLFEALRQRNNELVESTLEVLRDETLLRIDSMSLDELLIVLEAFAENGWGNLPIYMRIDRAIGLHKNSIPLEAIPTILTLFAGTGMARQKLFLHFSSRVKEGLLSESFNLVESLNLFSVYAQMSAMGFSLFNAFQKTLLEKDFGVFDNENLVLLLSGLLKTEQEWTLKAEEAFQLGFEEFLSRDIETMEDIGAKVTRLWGSLVIGNDPEVQKSAEMIAKIAAEEPSNLEMTVLMLKFLLNSSKRKNRDILIKNPTLKQAVERRVEEAELRNTGEDFDGVLELFA